MKGFLTSTERNLSPGRVKRRILTLLLILISCLFVNPSFLRAESRFDGKIIQKVELQSDGPLSRISTRDVLKLVVLREGAPYSASAAQRSIRRLYSTEIFHDVQIDVEPIGADQVGVKIFLIRKFSIQEFKFEGHLRLGRKQLRRELAFRSGEAYSEILMEEILSRLREIYERNGYYRPRIQPEFELDHRAARLTLRFRIDAGEQSRVDQLDFDVEGDLDLVKIRSLMKTREQAPFSRNQLEEDIRGLERYLAFQGYLRSYVAETVRYHDTKNSVSLTLRVVLRKKTKIEFQGIDANWEELADLPVFSRRGTTPIFLEATGKELRERYQKQGHFQARVEYETLGTERDFSAIVIKVSKGQKYDLKKVLFEGNEFAEDKTLLQIIRVETSGVFSRGRFSTEMAEGDVNRIRSYYQQRGFRDVDVSYGLLVENPHADDLSLVYKIEEGPRYFIEAVEFIGNEQLSTESLLKEIQGRPATPFSPSVVAQDRANVIAAYETRGYRQVDFRSEILYPEPGRARLTYFIQEGPQF
ncbi:MAG: POTRA domain-containing protein, partial [Acidobacteriota bacterium]